MDDRIRALLPHHGPSAKIPIYSGPDLLRSGFVHLEKCKTRGAGFCRCHPVLAFVDERDVVAILERGRTTWRIETGGGRQAWIAAREGLKTYAAETDDDADRRAFETWRNNIKARDLAEVRSFYRKRRLVAQSGDLVWRRSALTEDASLRRAERLVGGLRGERQVLVTWEATAGGEDERQSVSPREALVPVFPLMDGTVDPRSL